MRLGPVHSHALRAARCFGPSYRSVVSQYRRGVILQNWRGTVLQNRRNIRLQNRRSIRLQNRRSIRLQNRRSIRLQNRRINRAHAQAPSAAPAAMLVVSVGGLTVSAFHQNTSSPPKARVPEQQQRVLKSSCCGHRNIHATVLA